MSTSLHTALCDKLGCTYPIVQTAMGWVADSTMVAATANAGGFGFLAAAVMETELVESEIARIKSLTDKPFGINFHMFQPNAEDVIRLAIEHKLRAVSFGRGPDKAMIHRLRDAGLVCMPTVGAVRHAVKAVEMGADVVTIQGGEGGGHTGSVPSSILLPQVLDAVDVPVVAAGGFSTGRGLAGALASGAAGIAMGTRFLMTQESPVPQATLARYVDVANPAKIRVSHAVDGMPQRMIDNKFLDKLEAASALGRALFALKCAWQWKGITGMSTADLIRSGLKMMKDGDGVSQTLMAANAPTVIQRAMVQGDPDGGVLPSGQVAAAIGQLDSCEDVIKGIAAEAESCLNALCAQIQNTKKQEVA